MRVLLASPESEVWNSRQHVHMGLGYLAGALRAHGYNVEIWDASIEVEFESLHEKLSRDPFDIVCLSAPTPLIVQAWEAASVAKKHGAITILGGPHLTLMPHESMEKDMVDLVVRGEAEYTIVEIMQALEKNVGILRSRHQSSTVHFPVPDADKAADQQPRLFDPEAGWGRILGLSWRTTENKIMHNMERPLPEDIDAIPFPAFDMFRIQHYTNLNPLTDGLDMNARAYTIVTSRAVPTIVPTAPNPSPATPGEPAAWITWWLSGSGWSKIWAPPKLALPMTSGTWIGLEPKSYAGP